MLALELGDEVGIDEVGIKNVVRRYPRTFLRVILFPVHQILELAPLRLESRSSFTRYACSPSTMMGGLICTSSDSLGSVAGLSRDTWKVGEIR